MTAPAKATDEIALIRAALLASDDVQALVLDRVRADHVADADVSSIVYPCIIIERVGGNTRYQGSLRDVYFDLYTYSDESSDVTLAVYDAAFQALQAMKLVTLTGAVTARGYCRETARPEPGYNTSTRSWYARGSFRAMFAG